MAIHRRFQLKYDDTRGTRRLTACLNGDELVVKRDDSNTRLPKLKRTFCDYSSFGSLSTVVSTTAAVSSIQQGSLCAEVVADAVALHLLRSPTGASSKLTLSKSESVVSPAPSAAPSRGHELLRVLEKGSASFGSPSIARSETTAV